MRIAGGSKEEQRMLERLKKHPILYAIGVALLFLYSTGLPWFEKVWDAFFPNNPLPVLVAKWISSEGWKGMSPYLSAALLAISTLGVFTLLGIILYAVRQYRQEVRWLEDIARGDSQDMGHRIYLDSRDMSIRFPSHLNALEPYVDLDIHLHNISVYTLTLTHIEGRFALYGHSLHYSPEIVSSERTLPHAHHLLLVVRQRFLPESIQPLLKEGTLPLDIGNTALHFTYQSHDREIHKVRVALGNLPAPLLIS